MIRVLLLPFLCVQTLSCSGETVEHARLDTKVAKAGKSFCHYFLHLKISVNIDVLNIHPMFLSRVLFPSLHYIIKYILVSPK